MAIEQPGYALPNVAAAGGATHIDDHNTIRNALSELKGMYLIPDGGTSGYVLAKASGNNGDFAWVAQTGGSGTTDHSVLTNRTIADQHSIGSVSGLQAALDGKAASSHTHAASAITSGTLDYARIPAGSELVADKVKNGGTYPSRPTSRTDVTVVWIGDTDPTGALNGDRWIKTA